MSVKRTRINIQTTVVSHCKAAQVVTHYRDRLRDRVLQQLALLYPLVLAEQGQTKEVVDSAIAEAKRSFEATIQMALDCCPLESPSADKPEISRNLSEFKTQKTKSKPQTFEDKF